MNSSILRPRLSLIEEIAKLKTEITNLRDSFVLISKWINSKYDDADLPSDIARAIKQWAKFIQSDPSCEHFEATEGQKITPDKDEAEENTSDNEEIPKEIFATTREKEIPQGSQRNKKRHSASHGDFHCRVCNKKLKNLAVLNNHEREHLPQEVLVPLPSRANELGLTTKLRHAYRCLTCGLIISDRRKYITHVNKHRKTKKAIEKLRKLTKDSDLLKTVKIPKADKSLNPYVKLQNLNSLKEDVIPDLEKEYGIINFTSVINGLSTARKVVDELNDHDEIPIEFTSDDDGMAIVSDPLANDSTNEEGEQENWDDDFREYANSSQSNENLEDVIKDEIKEEFVDENRDTNSSNVGDSSDTQESSYQNDIAQTEVTPPMRIRQRKSAHKILKDDDFIGFGDEHKSSTSKMSPRTSELPTSRKTSEDQLNDSSVQCNICSKRLKNRDCLRSHLNEVHLPPEVLLPWKPGWKSKSGVNKRHRYRCLEPNCALILTNRRKYIQHVNQHKAANEKMNNEEECTQNLTDMDSNNTSYSFKAGPGQCEICHKIVKNLRSHKKEHLPAEVVIPLTSKSGRGPYIRPRQKYRCLTCKIIMSDKRKYIAHVKTHSRSSTSTTKNENVTTEEENEQGLVQCKICNKHVKPQSYKSHKKEHLPPEVVLPFNPDNKYNWQGDEGIKPRYRYRCPHCEVIMTDKRKYIVHVNKHLNGENPEKPDDGQSKKVYFCRVCNQSFKSKGYWERHERKHAKLSNSNAGYINTEEQEPEASKNSKKPFMCDLCGKTFCNGSGLKYHSYTHLEKRPYLCFQCGKGFRSARNLMDHELIHTDVRSHKCEFCDKDFKTRQSKDIHERRHRVGFGVTCHLCGFTFRGEYTLRKHIMAIHENQRPYGCHLCDKKFKTTSSLKYHVNTHNNPNGRKRGLNQDIDPLKAAAKRRHIENRNTVPIIPFVPPDNVLVNEDVTNK